MVITGKSNYQVITGNYQSTNLVTINGAAHGARAATPELAEHARGLPAAQVDAGEVPNRMGPAAARRRQGRQGGRSGSETTSPRETRLQENRPTMAAISAGSMDGFCEIYDGMIYV